MIAPSGGPSKLCRYAPRSCLPSGTLVSLKVVVPKPAEADCPPSPIETRSLKVVPATSPLMVLPLGGGGQDTNVPAVNGAWVMNCTVRVAAPPAPSTAYATPPPLLPMVKL